MAKGKKTGGKDYLAGNPGGPGRPQGSDSIKKLRKLTKAQVKEIGDLILTSGLDSLRDIPKNPNATILQIWISSVVTKAINRGDMSALNVLLDRLIGKVKEDLTIEIAVPTIIKRLSGEEVEYGSKLLETED